MSKKDNEGLPVDSRAQGILYALSAYLLWGILPIYWKALKQVPAGEILANRIVWSFVFVSLLLVFNGRWRDLKQVFTCKKNVLAVFWGALLISVNWLIFIWAVNNDKIVEASLGYYINPLFTIFLGMVILKERIDRWQLVALLLALLGVVVVTMQYGTIPWISLSLALTFGLYGLVKKMSKLDAIIGLGLETLLVAPLALGYLIYLAREGSGVLGTVGWDITLLLVLAGIVTATPLLLFAQGAKRVPLSTMGFIQYITPSMTLLLGVFVYKEPFNTIDLISFGFIWLALGIYTFSRQEVRMYLRQRWGNYRGGKG